MKNIHWFKHGKWPKWLVGLHYYTIGSFVLLAATGIAIYLPALHAPLLPYSRMLYKVHILLGFVFTITLITPFLRILPKGRRVWKLDWGIPILAGVPLVVTGIILWKDFLFPAGVGERAFTWHGVITIVFGAWILVHAFYKTLGIRPKPGGVAGRVDMERRLFLRWAATGLVSAAIVTILDPAALFRSITAAGSPGSDTGAIQGKGVQAFPAYYNVVDKYPSVDLASYRLLVNGNVHSATTLTWTQIQALPRYNETKDFHCVTGWSVPNVHWQGVHLSQLVDLVRPADNVKFVNFYSFDGVYTESLPLSEALDPSVLLAYQMDGQPLRQVQGAPIRLVVPKMYGYKSIKWVHRVEFSTHPLEGYWEKYGYPTEAYVKTGL